MKITITALKEFWSFPVGRQLASAAFIVIGALTTVIILQYFELGRGARREQVLEQEKGDIRRQCGDEKLAMQRVCDSEITALKNGQLADFRQQLDEMKLKEKVMDEAIMNANQIIATQQRTQRNVRRTINEALNK